MRVHANAKLGPAGRLALVRLVDGGCSLRAAAKESSVSVATAHRWWHRWQDASADRTVCTEYALAMVELAGRYQDVLSAAQ